MAFKLQQDIIVEPPSDTELVNFVEKCGIQVWPVRGSRSKVTAALPEVVEWWAQMPHPNFYQIAGHSWRNAVARLMQIHRRRAEDTPA